MNTLDHDWIAAHIPHQGSMCLLDEVVSWNDDQIICRAVSHSQSDNPLRNSATLGIANGIEYAAQAMAVHGALIAADGPPPESGFLTSVRNVNWFRDRLDDLDGDLIVRAERLSGNGSTILYDFTLLSAEHVLLSGRASVMLNADTLNTNESGATA